MLRKLALFIGVVSGILRSQTSAPPPQPKPPAPPPHAVLTYHYDNARTGLDPEPDFGVWHGNINKFGKLFAHQVDGQVYAQPLYVPKLTMYGPDVAQPTTHNVVFVATEADTVFAFDADNNKAPNDTYLWKASLIDTAHGAFPKATPVNTSDLPQVCRNIQPHIGITSTPVIDLATFTMYVEAKSREFDPETKEYFMVHRLHALDIRTGNEKRRPQIITTPGFDGVYQLNRPGLLLSQGTIYVGFGSHCDQGTYYGWLFAYDAGTLSQKAVFKVPTASDPTSKHESESGGAGIWMGGAGLAADSDGSLLVATGNASNAAQLGDGLGDSILKLDKNLKLTAIFTPLNQSYLGNNDLDLGSGGVLLLPDQAGPHPHLAVQAGKDGTINLIDRDLVNVVENWIPRRAYHDFVQTLDNAVGGLVFGAPCQSPGYGCVFGMPAFWNNTVYFSGIYDVLRAFSLVNGLVSKTPAKAASSSIQGGWRLPHRMSAALPTA